MKARLVFADNAAFASVSAEIEITAAIEGGVGAVKIGQPARFGGGRMVVSHRFSEADLDWIVTYANDPRMVVEGEES